MVKKSVPDWLNSSLWSAPPPQPPPPPSPKPSRDAVRNPPVQAPTPREPYRGRPNTVIGEISDPLTASTNFEVGNTSDGPYGGGGGGGIAGGGSGGASNYYESDDENESSSVNSANSATVHSVPSPTVAGPTVPPDFSRQAQILQELSRKVINMGELRRLVSQGIPDGAEIRPTVWKLLLFYLPADHSLWPSELAKKRSQYRHFKEELLMNPSEIARRLENSSLENNETDGSPGFLSRSEITEGEHPLNLGKTSIWNQYFQDSEIIEQIDRDVQRTHPDIQFFSGDTSFAKLNQEALRRILIIFAKLNPGIRYVQGMNEILAPLYYVFKNDPDEDNAVYAEADTFFCFVELLSGFRDNFVQQLDNSVVGIRSTINRLSMLLKDHDEELWRHLEMTTKVNPQFYAFRWITLLLTQEFNFADSLVIWDTLLSDPDGPQETLLRICCAMLIIVRKRLLAGDFTANLKLLQNYPSTNISHLLYVASKLRLTG